MAVAKKKVDLTDPRGREKLFLDIIGHLLRYNDQERKEIATEAGISKSCVYQWTHGNTISPQIRTLAAVARVMGYEIVMRRIAAPKAVVKRIK